MIIQLQANTPMLVGSYGGVVTVYIRQYGAGNLRYSTAKEDLLNGVNLAPGQIVDGIPQAAADGIQQRFWSGDLWIISDAAGPAMVIAPAYAAYVDRLKSTALPSGFQQESETEGDLSTYQ